VGIYTNVQSGPLTAVVKSCSASNWAYIFWNLTKPSHLKLQHQLPSALNFTAYVNNSRSLPIMNHFVSAPGQSVSRALQVRICICICIWRAFSQKKWHINSTSTLNLISIQIHNYTDKLNVAEHFGLCNAPLFHFVRSKRTIFLKCCQNTTHIHSRQQHRCSTTAYNYCGLNQTQKIQTRTWNKILHKTFSESRKYVICKRKQNKTKITFSCSWTVFKLILALAKQQTTKCLQQNTNQPLQLVLSRTSSLCFVKLWELTQKECCPFCFKSRTGCRNVSK